MMKLLILVLLAFVAVACNPIPGTKVQTSNPAATNVEVLFDVDGYRVYRFSDNSRDVYFVLPANGERTASTAWTEGCGRNCTRDVTVITSLKADGR